jgi:aromatic-L-amino-acid decarboxylase
VSPKKIVLSVSNLSKILLTSRKAYSSQIKMPINDVLPNGHINQDENLPLDPRTAPPLGMTGEQFIQAANASAQEIEHYYSNMSSRNVLPSISPGYLRKLLPTSAPEQGETWEDIQSDIERAIMPGVTHWQHPKFMAFFPATTSYPSMLGEMWSSALSSPAFNWICSPVVTELETIVLDWFADIVGLPKSFKSDGEGGGVIQLSASDTILTVMIAARERYIRRELERQGVTDPEDVEDRSCELRGQLVALGSDQAHSSTKKAATMAGTRFRTITTHHSDNYALKGHEVRKKIEELHSKGLRPYYLTVTIGTTSTCSVDDFASIAEVAKDYPDIWIHCDGAYAGSALVLPEYHYLSKQMSFVDSFNFNVHKWLMVNFDASVLYIQKRRDLTDTMSITPAYLKNQFTDSGLVTDYRDWQIPLGRRFRSLKIWFVLRTYGVQGLKNYVQHGINLGSLFANLIRSRDDLFSIFTPPAFGLVVFTVNPHKKQQPRLDQNLDGADPRPDQDQHVSVRPRASDEELREANEVTKEVFEIIDAQKEFFLTSTVVGGVYAIRVVSANPQAQEKYVREVFDVLVRTAEEVLQGRDTA